MVKPVPVKASTGVVSLGFLCEATQFSQKQAIDAARGCGIVSISLIGRGDVVLSEQIESVRDCEGACAADRRIQSSLEMVHHQADWPFRIA